MNDKIFSRKTAVYLAAIGFVLVGLSFFSSKTEGAQKLSVDNYSRYLEARLEEMISQAGCGKASVLITMKEFPDENTVSVSEQESLFLFSEKGNSSKSKTAHEIAGVVIVCSSIKDTSDFNIIKEAASTALDIPKNKIYIFGGVANP